MEIEYWETSRGEAIVLEDIKLQDVKLRVKIHWVIEQLGEVGLALGPPHCKKLTGYDLYELKAGGYRIIFAIKLGTAHLLHSFHKDANSTRKRHINLAVTRSKLI